MPSSALIKWKSVRANRLDEIESAHRALGGAARGRRYATQQLNHAYTVLLSSEFQGFCRDLHSESVEALVAVVTPSVLRRVLHSEYHWNRKLDKGNPNPSNIAADFNRLGILFQAETDAYDRRNAGRREALEMLNRWRNAVAHQDFSSPGLGRNLSLRLVQVRRWRRICNALAQSYDAVLYNYLQTTTGVSPW